MTILEKSITVIKSNFNCFQIKLIGIIKIDKVLIEAKLKCNPNKYQSQTKFNFSFILKFCVIVEMKWLKLVILIALVLSELDCKPHVGNESFADIEGDSIRLPGHTRPINYDVELNVNVHNGSTPYSGKVTIRITVDTATDVITLHNKGLLLTQVKVLDANNEELQNTVELDTVKDFLKIKVDSALTVGNEYTLEISFNGVISMDSNGFYRMSYRNIETNEMR